MAKNKHEQYSVTLRDLYERLLKKGFTEEQAFYILATVAKKVFDAV